MPGTLRARDAFLVPGLVSSLRFVLAIAFPFAVAHPVSAVALLVGAGASDVLDGWLARRRGEVTAMGAVIDGVADKVFVASVVVTLALRHGLTGLEVALLSTREIMETPVLVWRLIRPPRLAREHRASALGKATTALQFATLFGVVLGLGHVVPL